MGFVIYIVLSLAPPKKSRIGKKATFKKNIINTGRIKENCKYFWSLFKNFLKIDKIKKIVTNNNVAVCIRVAQTIKDICSNNFLRNKWAISNKQKDTPILTWEIIKSIKIGLNNNIKDKRGLTFFIVKKVYIAKQIKEINVNPDSIS